MSRLTCVKLLSILVACSVAACGPAAPSNPPVAGSPAPTAQPLAPTPPADDPTQPTASPRSSDPPPEAIVLGGTWIQPAPGATLTSPRTTLAADPTAGGTGEATLTKVVFRVRPKGGQEIVACVAKTPGGNGAWACKVDLLALGVPPGALRLSFDVAGEGATTARSPDGARHVTYAVAPPKPSEARWEDLGGRRTGRYEFTRTYRVRWSAPAGYATEFLLYDTWDCPRDSARHVGEPCFGAGTRVDVSALKLLGRADGDARSMKVQIVEPECGPSFGTVLLRARNAYGNSVFAIIEVALVPDPRDMIC